MYIRLEEEGQKTDPEASIITTLASTSVHESPRVSMSIEEYRSVFMGSQVKKTPDMSSGVTTTIDYQMISRILRTGICMARLSIDVLPSTEHGTRNTMMTPDRTDI